MAFNLSEESGEMAYEPRAIVSSKDFDFILENIEDSKLDLDGDLRVGWYEATKWSSKLQWKMPNDFEFQHQKVGIIVVTNSRVVRYGKKMWCIIVDSTRKIYFSGEILGLPNNILSSVQSGPKRSISISARFNPSGRYATLSPDTLWVLLEAPGYRIWGHWIIDHFPRLYLLYKLRLIDRVKFVFFEPPPSWTNIFFEMFSISKDQMVVVKESCIRADQLIIPTFFREQNQLFIEYLVEAWQFLQQKLLEKKSKESFITRIFSGNRYLKKVQKAGKRKNLRIYISRGNSKSCLKNEQAFHQLLSRYDFFTLFPEQIDLPNTFAFLQNADMVVGEDGSGMHNVIFCRQTCDVIVINSRIRPQTNQLRENYYQRVMNDNLFDRSWFYTPQCEAGQVSMDIADFERYLQKVIAESH